MVTEPITAALAGAEPETMPKARLPATDTWAGPPRMRPATRMAKALRRSPIPARMRNSPRTTNTKM
jgi:hypothetical protein